MFQNRFTTDNGQADDAAIATVANGNTQSANGKHCKSAKPGAPSTNRSNGEAGRHGGLPHIDAQPSTNESNGGAGRLGGLPHIDAQPSTNESNGEAGRLGGLPHIDAQPSTNESNGGAGRHGGLPHGDPQPSTNESNGAAAAEHRSKAGKFSPGNKGGPGNPFARQVAQLRKVMIDATTPQRMRNVADMLYERTMKGDMAAAKLLLAYTIGKPKPATEPDLLDEDEWERHKAHAPMFDELSSLVTKCSPELPLELVRSTKPVVTFEQGSMLKTMLAAPRKKQDSLLDPTKHMTNAQFAAEMRKLAAEQAKAKAKAPPSTNGSNGAPANQQKIPK